MEYKRMSNNTLLSMFVFIEGNGTSGGILSFKQYALSYQTTTNHTNIYAIANSKINFSFYQTDGSFKLFNFDVSSSWCWSLTYITLKTKIN